MTAEPLLEPELIGALIHYAQERIQGAGAKLHLSLTTNGTPDCLAPSHAASMSRAAARSQIMNFGLLLSQLPQVSESRPHYEAMLSLDSRQPVLVRIEKVDGTKTRATAAGVPSWASLSV